VVIVQKPSADIAKALLDFGDVQGIGWHEWSIRIGMDG
jgi:hypothetical protein